MTSAVLRVKRRAEDTPQEALVLLCKRLKTDLADNKGAPELAPNVFVFSGTVEDQENTHSHIRKLWSKSEPKCQEPSSTKSATEILKKIRKEHKETKQGSRYEILNCSRGLKDELQDDASEVGYTLVDVAMKSGEEGKDVQYAYDLYFSQKEDFDVSMLDDIVRIEQLEGSLVAGSRRDDGRRSSSEASSDDSNDENNWRNDYPDTEGSSVGEEDMRRAFEDIDIGSDLSSDTGEEDIYNDRPVDPAALDPGDVQRYGVAYAKYKARVLANETDLEDKRNLVFCTTVKVPDEESADYKDEEEGFYYGMEEDTEQFISQYRQDESDDEQPD